MKRRLLYKTYQGCDPGSVHVIISHARTVNKFKCEDVADLIDVTDSDDDNIMTDTLPQITGL